MMNKVLPGVYAKIRAGERKVLGETPRVAAMAMELDWGEEITILSKGEDTLERLGYSLDDQRMVLVKEILRHGEVLLLYRMNSGGSAASSKLGENLTVTAVYPGVRGNDLTVTAVPQEDGVLVQTFLDGMEMDRQLVEDAGELQENDWVRFAGTGEPAAATAVLTGGSSGEVQETAYDVFLKELEGASFQTLIYTGEDQEIQQKICGFVERMRENGAPVQAVMSGVAADSEGIINCTVGGITSAGVRLSPKEACATLGGILSGLGKEGSATHYLVEGWSDVLPRLSRSQQEIRTKKGETLFVWRHGQAMVLYDRNSLVSFTDSKPEDFSKNLVIRTLDGVVEDLSRLLEQKAVGKIRNSEIGRNQIKGMVAEMIGAQYLDKGYIEGFTAGDVEVLEGQSRDSVIVKVGIRVADTMDKIYLTVQAD